VQFGVIYAGAKEFSIGVVALIDDPAQASLSSEVFFIDEHDTAWCAHW